jgi:hypothetical protein
MSNIMSVKNKATALARVQALIAGTQKHFPNGQFTLGNTAYTTASLVQTLQGLVDAFAPVNAAHASVKDTVAAFRAEEAKVAPVIRVYTSYIHATFSDASAPLGDFGLQPRKVRQPLATDKRVVAAAKVKATRAARGTTSKKKKLAVKGDVTGVIMTPVTHASPAPASPSATSAAPAPVATAPAAAPK